jgi:hypothetical protein
MTPYYNEGFRAFSSGARNPYPKSSRESLYWTEGYFDAQEEEFNLEAERECW